MNVLNRKEELINNKNITIRELEENIKLKTDLMLKKDEILKNNEILLNELEEKMKYNLNKNNNDSSNFNNIIEQKDNIIVS